MKENSIGRVIYEYSRKDAAKRIGSRIRKVRKAKGLSQTELGARVGLNGDRIQKYENGVRKPKADILEKLADALDVEIQAFADPDTSTYIGAMYAFFEMEELFGLYIERQGNDLALKFGGGYVSELNEHLSQWERKKKQVEEALEKASSDEEKAEILKEYDLWKWNYPPVTEFSLKNR